MFPSGNYLLTSLGSQLTELTFNNVVICKKSIYCLFLGLAWGTEQRLKKLVIRYTGNGSSNLVESADMSEVPCELLAKVTERLDILRFRQIRISTDQLIEVLVASRSSEQPLKKIELSLINLSQVQKVLIIY